MKVKNFILLILVCVLAISCSDLITSKKDVTTPTDYKELKCTSIVLNVTTGLTNTAKYEGTDTPTDLYDELTLLVNSSETNIWLDNNCLGVYSGYAKKVIVPEVFTSYKKNAFVDSTIEEIDFENENVQYTPGTFSSCTNLRVVQIAGKVQ